MRKFTLEKLNVEKKDDNRYVFQMNGKTFPNSIAYHKHDGDGYYSFQSYDDEIIEAILSCTPDEMLDVEYLTLTDETFWHGLERTVHIAPLTKEFVDEKGDPQWEASNWNDPDGIMMTLRMGALEEEWEGGFSFLALSTAIEEIVSDLDYEDFSFLFQSDYESSTVSVSHLMTPDLTFGLTLKEPLAACEAVFDDAFAQIEENLVKGEMLASFEFPDELRVPCQQYLLYFSQFLKDLGIDAKSVVSEDAGRILFSVLPADGVDALQRIREALAVYLNLPESEVSFDDSFASMRLQQQVENLKHSQTLAGRELKLAQLVIEGQDRIIDEKNDTIAQQQRVIQVMSPSVMMNSATNKGELEEIYQGVRIGESEMLKKWLGIGFNPAKTLSAVGKTLLGRSEPLPSILNTDDQDDKT